METITVVSKLLYHNGVNILGPHNNVLVDRGYVTDTLVGVREWIEPGANDVEYKLGDLVQFQGKVYKCLESFTTDAPSDPTTEAWADTSLSTKRTGVIDFAEDGSVDADSVTIEHGLNSKNLMVQLFDDSGSSISGFTVSYLDFNNVTISGDGLFASGTYRVLITALD